MQKINLKKYKEILKYQFSNTPVTAKNIKDLALPNKYSNQFPNLVDKKLLNQNRFIIELNDSNIKSFLTFLANYSFLDKKTKIPFNKWFITTKFILSNQDINNIEKIIEFNITHSLKSLNTNFNGNLYFTEKKPSYGLTSSDFCDSLPFTTTEGNATINSKYPLFYFNFIFNGKAYNIIEFIKLSQKNENLVVKILSNFMNSNDLKNIILKIKQKNTAYINNTLGYQIIVNDNKNDFITISPSISIKALQQYSKINKEYINNLNVLNEEEDESKREFFLQKISYGLGGEKPQNINPYFSFQSGRVNAFKSYIPYNENKNRIDKLLNKIVFKESLLNNIYLSKEEINNLTNTIVSIENIDSFGNNNKSTKIAKSLNFYIKQSFNDLIYLRNELDIKNKEIQQILMEKKILAFRKR